MLAPENEGIGERVERAGAQALDGVGAHGEQDGRAALGEIVRQRVSGIGQLAAAGGVLKSTSRERRLAADQAPRAQRFEGANDEIVRYTHVAGDFRSAPVPLGVRMQEQEDLEHFEARDEVAQ